MFVFEKKKNDFGLIAQRQKGYLMSWIYLFFMFDKKIFLGAEDEQPVGKM
jgi:hypothetical protein